MWRAMPIATSRLQTLVILALAALLWPRMASSAWEVDAHGDCVRTWTAESLLRGPTALANAPLAPIRSAVGGAILARDDLTTGGVRRVLLLGPTLTVMGGAMGFVDTGVWLVTGLADTVTGGYFETTPDEATPLSVAPITPLFVPDARRPAHVAAHQDPCGRPLGP